MWTRRLPKKIENATLVVSRGCQVAASEAKSFFELCPYRSDRYLSHVADDDAASVFNPSVVHIDGWRHATIAIEISQQFGDFVHGDLRVAVGNGQRVGDGQSGRDGRRWVSAATTTTLHDDYYSLDNAIPKQTSGLFVCIIYCLPKEVARPSGDTYCAKASGDAEICELNTSMAAANISLWSIKSAARITARINSGFCFLIISLCSFPAWVHKTNCNTSLGYGISSGDEYAVSPQEYIMLDISWLRA